VRDHGFAARETNPDPEVVSSARSGLHRDELSAVYTRPVSGVRHLVLVSALGLACARSGPEAAPAGLASDIVLAWSVSGSSAARS
jgi:hypothetical protein